MFFQFLVWYSPAGEANKKRFLRLQNLNWLRSRERMTEQEETRQTNMLSFIFVSQLLAAANGPKCENLVMQRQSSQHLVFVGHRRCLVQLRCIFEAQIPSIFIIDCQRQFAKHFMHCAAMLQTHVNAWPYTWNVHLNTHTSNLRAREVVMSIFKSQLFRLSVLH